MSRSGDTICVVLLSIGLTLILMGGIMDQHWISKVGGVLALLSLLSIGFFHLHE